jgi:hypothetical protein
VWAGDWLIILLAVYGSMMPIRPTHSHHRNLDATGRHRSTKVKIGGGNEDVVLGAGGVQEGGAACGWRGGAARSGDGVGEEHAAQQQGRHGWAKRNIFADRHIQFGTISLRTEETSKLPRLSAHAIVFTLVVI